MAAHQLERGNEREPCLSSCLCLRLSFQFTAQESSRNTQLLLDSAQSGCPDPDSPAIASAALGMEHERVLRWRGMGELPELS